MASRKRKKTVGGIWELKPGRQADVAAATGTDVPALQMELVGQVIETMWFPSDLPKDQYEQRLKSACTMLEGIKPRGEIEGMLAAQMVATHSAAMECLRRAMLEGQTFEGRDQNLKHAAKLLSIYTRQMEALNKHRGKGQQKVTVEYVNVEAGGQAVVGNVEAGTVKPGAERRRGPKQKSLPNAQELPVDLASPEAALELSDPPTVKNNA